MGTVNKGGTNCYKAKQRQSDKAGVKKAIRLWRNRRRERRYEPTAGKLAGLLQAGKTMRRDRQPSLAITLTPFTAKNDF